MTAQCLLQSLNTWVYLRTSPGERRGPTLKSCPLTLTHVQFHEINKCNSRKRRRKKEQTLIGIGWVLEDQFEPVKAHEARMEIWQCRRWEVKSSANIGRERPLLSRADERESEGSLSVSRFLSWRTRIQRWHLWRRKHRGRERMEEENQGV